MDVLSPFISVILIDSYTGSPVYILMLSIQAMRGLPRLHAPGIVHCIISFSKQLPSFFMVWPQYAGFRALTVSNSFLFTPALLRTHSKSFCFFFLLSMKPAESFSAHPFISKASRRVSLVFLNFFLSVQLSQPYFATGHTSAFISRIFVEIGMLWLFHIFCSDATIACPLFNLVLNSVVYSPSSVIRDPRYGKLGTYPPAPVSHSEWVCGTLYRRSPLTWSCQRWWVGCIYGWLGLGDPPAPVVLPPKWLTRCYQRSDESQWFRNHYYTICGAYGYVVQLICCWYCKIEISKWQLLSSVL